MNSMKNREEKIKIKKIKVGKENKTRRNLKRLK